MGCKCVVGISSSAIIIMYIALLANVDGQIRKDEICGNFNGRRMYLELGERGTLTARNVTVGNPLSDESHEQCSLEIVTCPSCVIAVTFRHLDLPQLCAASSHGPCQCDAVWVSEPPYGDASGMPFCGGFNSPSSAAGSAVLFRSETRTVSIVLMHSGTHQHAFTLDYTSERNRQFLKSTSSKSVSISPSLSNESSVGGILKSPYFPAAYPRDLGVEYVINCQIEISSNCRVRLIFRDFQLASVSIMEFHDWNGNRIEVSSGAVFRPPVILSTGPSLMVRFYANGGTDLGYKAVYSFLSLDVKDESVKPITDCGGYVENFGGAITMMKMVDRGIQTYDCIWLIRPPRNYLHVKSHLYLKVESFSDMAGGTELLVLQGLTSDRPVVETLRYPAVQAQPIRIKEHVINGDTGFYISLRGVFSAHSRLAIVYASFSYRDCFIGSDFLCKNHRCIPLQLSCDGFDHCGDNSDEPTSCLEDSERNLQERQWYARTPNYYFPKINRYPDLKTATIVFLASSLGMIMLISALIVLLYHMGARARQQRELQNQLQTINDLLDGSHNNNLPDEPPTYEAPPNYDEIINMFFKPSERTRRRKRRRCANRRSQSSPPSANKTLRSTAARYQPPQQESPFIVSRSCQTTPYPATPPPPYTPTPTPEPGCSVTPPPRLSRRGARTRESWLLFKDDSSTEGNSPTVSQSSDNNITNALNSPTCNIHNQVASVNMNQNLKIISNCSEEDVQNSGTSTELIDNNSQTMNSTLLDRISNPECEIAIKQFERSMRQGKGLQPMRYSFDAGSSRNDLESCDDVSRSTCSCDGACGCANALAVTQAYGQLTRSMSVDETLDSPSKRFQAINVCSSEHEIRSVDPMSQL